MGCFPVNKNIKVKSQNQIKTSDNVAKNNIVLEGNESTNTHKLTLQENDIKHINKEKLENVYSIVQKCNTKIANSFKVISKLKQDIFIMKIVKKDKIKNQSKFFNDYQKIIKKPIDRMVKIVDIYEDNLNYYIISENFEGEKLIEFANIENKYYNKILIKKIIYNLLCLQKDLNALGINEYYFSPDNIFCFFNDKDKFKLTYYFSNQIDINDSFISPETNLIYKIMFQTVKSTSNQEWQIGFIMYILFYGEIIQYKKLSSYKEIYKEMKEYIEKTLSDETTGKVMITLLSNKKLRSSLEKEYLQKNKNSKIINLLNEFDNDKLDSIQTSMSNYVFLAQHYQLFNELLDINKKISLVLSVIQSNEVTLSELKIKLSTLLGDSLTEMEIEKIKSVDNIKDNNRIININDFYSEMFLINYNQQYRLFKRIYSKITVSKENLIKILSYDTHQVFQRIMQSVKEIKESEITSEIYYSILFDVFCKEVIGPNHLIEILEKHKLENNNKFIVSNNSYIVASKWYSNEDNCHMDSLIKDHCSSSDICSSDEEEKKDI